MKPDTTLTKVIVGGEPVAFTKKSGTLHLGGEELTLKQWQEIERRINLFYIRAGMIKDPKKNRAADPNSGTSSFLTHNVQEVLRREVGTIQDPPWYLRGKYSGVITKERYGDNI